MAISETVRKIGQVVSGVFLSLTGSWLLVICVGGLLTLGALSLFHLGVLLSLGCIGLCLCVAGVVWLTSALSGTGVKSVVYYPTSEELTSGWLLQEEGLKKHPKAHGATSNTRWRLHPERNRTDMPEATSATSSRRSYNPFN